MGSGVEKVLRLAIAREEGFVYYLKRGDVWRVSTGPGAAARPERVAAGVSDRSRAYIYFLDRDGDIARAARSAAGEESV